MSDQFPPDLASGIGRVRKYIPDLVPLEDPRNPENAPTYLLSDTEIEGFLLEYAPSGEPARAQVKRAAADAIDAIANNEALVLKKIKTEDLETDGAKVADALRKGAKALRDQAAEEDANDSAFFDVVPFRHYHPQTRYPTRYGGMYV